MGLGEQIVSPPVLAAVPFRNVEPRANTLKVPIVVEVAALPPINNVMDVSPPLPRITLRAFTCSPHGRPGTGSRHAQGSPTGDASTETTQLEERLRAGTAWTPGEWVFTNEIGDPIRPDVLAARFVRRVKALGLPLTDVKGLRHAHATALLRAGVHPKVV